jgi:hypothetical protein
MKAFPNLQLVVSDMGNVRAVTQSDSGMDLRDYFAGQILSRFIELGFQHDDQIIPNPEFSSIKAYIYADAMMKARENKNGK